MRSEKRRFPDRRGRGDKPGFGKGEKCRYGNGAAGDAEDSAKKIVQPA